MRPLLVLALVSSGCYATGGPYHHHHYGLGAALADLAVVGIEAGIAASLSSPPPAPPSPPPAIRPFIGNVRWSPAQPAPGLHVVLRGTSGFVVLEALTDPYGDFSFPLPLPRDWYTLSLEDPTAVGSVRVWLDERAPGGLVLYAHPRMPPIGP